MIRRALWIGVAIVVLLVARDWVYVTTYRLTLEHRVDAPAQSSAAQQFELEGGRVLSRIVTRGADRIAFATDAGESAHVRVQLRPQRPTSNAPTSYAPTSYEIVWRDGGAHRTLARGKAAQSVDVDGAYPSGRGVIELVSDAPVVWSDPRVVRDFTYGRHLAELALLLGALSLVRRKEEPTRRLAFRLAAVTIGGACALLASEVALRALGDGLPNGIIAERHDLGELTRDPQWVDSPRYGRRLRPNVDTLNEWRFGDVVRLGYVPAAVSSGTLHQFTFHSDAEGFRNARVREQFEIAALGDSFTDAMTMRAEDSWPSRLEQSLGVSVQNYGTAGFGPPQELLVLKDFVAPHRPRRVVLAFFAGNDIFDAEAFDDFQRSGGVTQRAAPGWRIKDVVSRADTWFLVSALRAFSRRVDAGGDLPLPARAEDARLAGTSGEAAVAAFDRGMFDVPINGTRLRFAFMPPYLNTLNFSSADLGARRGWALTAAAIREMHDVSRSFGANFVVMFIPFKSQVYLGAVDRALPRQELERALGFYLESFQRPVDVPEMIRNRFAQNELVRRLCEREGIPMLDLTPTLEQRVMGGENMYFPDESHLNEAGEAVAAETLAAFLRALPLE